MKRITMILFGVTAFVTVKAQTTVATLLSDKIAQKMKDTLSLNLIQKTQIYTINMQLTTSKNLIRQLNVNTDSIRIKTQRIENTRDTLYYPVLTNTQYLLYKQKKRNIVNNN